MKTTTLGFEDDSRISKVEIAKLQINEAIAQFLEGNFVCAITLAGAGEAVLAGILTAAGESSVVEDSTNSIQRIRKVPELSAMDESKPKEIYNSWNQARNQLKHHNKAEEDFVTMNLFDEAYWMLKRALTNSKKLSINITKEKEFEKWIIINISM